MSRGFESLGELFFFMISRTVPRSEQRLLHSFVSEQQSSTRKKADEGMGRSNPSRDNNKRTDPPQQEDGKKKERIKKRLVCWTFLLRDPERYAHIDRTVWTGCLE